MSDVQMINDASPVEIQSNDLRGRAAPREVKFGASGKILGAIAVLLLIGGVGAYVYTTLPAQQHHTPQHVALNQLPQMPANPPAQQTPQ